jgi:hypothetical protein
MYRREESTSPGSTRLTPGRAFPRASHIVSSISRDSEIRELTGPAVSEVVLSAKQFELPGTLAVDTFDKAIYLSFASVSTFFVRRSKETHFVRLVTSVDNWLSCISMDSQEAVQCIDTHRSRVLSQRSSRRASSVVKSIGIWRIPVGLWHRRCIPELQRWR